MCGIWTTILMGGPALQNHSRATEEYLLTLKIQLADLADMPGPELGGQRLRLPGHLPPQRLRRVGSAQVPQGLLNQRGAQNSIPPFHRKYRREEVRLCAFC